MIKNWYQFNESVNQSIKEDVEDIFLSVAEKWNLKDSTESENSWHVTLGHAPYLKSWQGSVKLNIFIDAKRWFEFDSDLSKFFSRLESFGYKSIRQQEYILNSGQKYYYIHIENFLQKESFKSGINPKDLRVSEEEFLKRESQLKRVDYTAKEIESIKQITDFENSYLQNSHYKLTPETVGNTISFDTLCGHFYFIIIKCEDEWYLIEERPKRTKWGQGNPSYMVVDGFEQLEEVLKWYVGR